jgi:hypothetical protein
MNWRAGELRVLRERAKLRPLTAAERARKDRLDAELRRRVRLASAPRKTGRQPAVPRGKPMTRTEMREALLVAERRGQTRLVKLLKRHLGEGTRALEFSSMERHLAGES